jgi:hypothetical protein
MPVNIFFAYAHKNEAFLDSLKEHLQPLVWQGFIKMWHDRDISKGRDWERTIHEHLETAQIIVLLVSPAFLASEYCYSVEMRYALERHNAQTVRVIPVILEPCLWVRSPLSPLQVASL